MSATCHSRPGRASGKSGHVRCELKAEVNSEPLMTPFDPFQTYRTVDTIARQP
jgi:hypothetical protein